MPLTKQTEAALLNWVNTFPLDSKVQSLAELSGGEVLAELLKDIDPDYAVEDLEKHRGPSVWLSKKKSLEAVYKSLLRYIRDCCDDTDSLPFERAIDFNRIAEHDDPEQMVKLLTILLIAAMKGSTGQKYYEKLMTLDEKDQMEIAAVIQEMESQAGNMSEPLSPRPVLEVERDTTTVVTDRDLAREEAHAILKKEHEDLKKRHADYLTRFERLEENYFDLQEHSKEADRELETYRMDNSSDRTRYTESLQEKLREANDLIASQERQLEQDRGVKEQQAKELHSLKSSNKQFRQLEDEVVVLKNENESLSKKANALDNYQKKLDRMSRIETDNETLRRRLDVLQENQQDYDKVYQENTMLQRTTDEYRVRFQTYEEDLLNLNREKKHVETELYSCRARILTLEEMKQHDERFIEDLQDQLKAGVQNAMQPESPADMLPSHSNLEDELDRRESGDGSLIVERLKAENLLLKNKANATASATLRSSMDELDRKYKRLQEKHQEVLEMHAAATFQLNAIRSAEMSEKDEAILQTRALYLSTNDEKSKLQKQLQDIRTETSSHERELASARADLKAMRSSEVEALETLKATHQFLTTSFETELQHLRTRCDTLNADAETANKHLLSALLAKSALEAQVADSALVPSVEPPPALDTDAAADHQHLQERIEELQHELADEREKLRQREGEKGLDELARENRLVASAWYDVTSRLQSNLVVLQRRQEVPRSWLARQRHVVVGAGSSGRR